MSKYASSILVTGGTQGLGYYCSLELARQCPDSLIIVASRTDPINSATKINSTLQQSNVQFMALDLSSLSKVREFATRWQQANHPPIRALVLNAGLQLPGALEWTEDGIEKTFAINHVGHALLFHLLAAHLTPDARIVLTSSGVHDPETGVFNPAYTTAEEVAKPGRALKKASNGRDRYATSKAANVVWMHALARHLPSGRTATALDPGLMPGTGLGREANVVLRALFAASVVLVPVLRKLFGVNMYLPWESGKSLAWLAVGEECKGRTGVYYRQRVEVPSSAVSRVESTQEELWRWTIEFVGRSPEERAKFERFE